ncbi:hypothetical protein QBC37DRAFT_68334 [Rhypophila decipiens]|uniref:Uncharacterized protein n=1 Tax=Rhypophila decipiens TaxID=261697 RepID=A0AAN6YG36_9PEZI|nr:hypothetical protein QBC37DRAFT_68334 [Rhypophila decipiens]
MSSPDNSNSNTTYTANPNEMAARQQRRGSVSSAALSSLFRSNSISQAQTGVAGFPGPLTTAALNDQRRRLSITTLGLSGTSPSASTSFVRRGSVSTNSDSIDESAIDEEDAARTAPTTPFTRRMSYGANPAMRAGVRGGTSPGTGRPSPPLRRASTAAHAGPSSPPLPSPGAGNYTWGKVSSQASTASQPRTASDVFSPSARSDQGFNWSDQLRSRAESTVASGGPRASFSFTSGLSASPPRSSVPSAGAGPPAGVGHDRAKSVSDMPAPPAQAPRHRPQKPDAFQERILKGDFYMD